jgi:hypothetical protein
MSLQKVKFSDWINAYIDAHSKIKYPEFVGLYEEKLHWDYYLTDDKLSGFAITPEKELTHLFNANASYKFLDDPEVVKIINSEVKWFVCIGYYESQPVGKYEFAIQEKSLKDYYLSKLNFEVFGTTEADVEDMIETIGLPHTVTFVGKYGIPFQIFFLNKKYPFLNAARYGCNKYSTIKRNIMFYIESCEEAEEEVLIEKR